MKNMNSHASPRSVAFSLVSSSLLLLGALPPSASAQTYQTTPNLNGVQTMWIGNTFGGHPGPIPPIPQAADQHAVDKSLRIPPGFYDVDATSDGTAYTIGRADGRSTLIYKDGMMRGVLAFLGNNIYPNPSVSADDKYVFAAWRYVGTVATPVNNTTGGKNTPATGNTWFTIARYTPGGLWAPFQGADGIFGNMKVINSTLGSPKAGPVQGIVSSGTKVYVADTPNNRILAFDEETMQPATPASVTMDRPGRMAIDPQGNLWVLPRPIQNTTSTTLRVNCGGPQVGLFEPDRYEGSFRAGTTTYNGTPTNPNAAPADVYKTNEYYSRGSHLVTGWQSGAAVNVRLHLMEPSATAANVNVFNISVNQVPLATGIDTYQIAGGKLVPATYEFVAIADDRGSIYIEYQSTRGYIYIAGYEMTGPRVTSETYPTTLKSFDQNLAPRPQTFPLPSQSEIVDIDMNAAGEIFLADNGPSGNVKVYDLAAPSVVKRTIGASVLSGPTPGAKTPSRFPYLTGVAADSRGYTFVSNDAGDQAADVMGAEVAGFKPDGTLDWLAEGHIFFHDPSWDRGPSGTGDGVMHTTNRGYAINLDGPAGANWSTSSYTLDRFTYAWDLRNQFNNSKSTSATRIRYVNSKKYQFALGTQFQMPIMIHRFPTGSQVAVPHATYIVGSGDSWRFPGAPASESIWVDSNQDGFATSNEYLVRAFNNPNSTSKNGSTPYGVYIDPDGGIWSASSSYIRYLPGTVDGSGNLTYDWNNCRFWNVPSTFKNKNVGRIHYDKTNDVLYLSGVDTNTSSPYTNYPGGQPDGRLVGNLIARFNGWKASIPGGATPSQLLTPPAAAWSVPIPFNSASNQGTRANVDLPVDMVVEGDYVFVPYNTFGRTRIYQISNGAFVGIFGFGPSMQLPKIDGSGLSTHPVEYGTLDTPDGLQVIKRSNGKYAMVFHDDFANRATLLQWTPSENNAPAAVTNLSARQAMTNPKSSITLSWTGSGASSYKIDRMSARQPWQEVSTVTTNTFTDTGLAEETLYFYRLRGVGSGTSDYSNVTDATTSGSRSISLDFVGGSVGAPTTAMAATEVAGFRPRQNWNNLTGVVGTTPVALKDDAAASTTAQVTWRADESNGDHKILDQAGDRRMMRGLIGNRANGVNPLTVNITGIPFASYTVYYYYDTPDVSKGGAMDLTIGGRSFYVADRPNVDYHSGYWTVNHKGPGNCVVSRGMTGSSLAISASASSTLYFGSPLATQTPVVTVNGIQIVEDPAPPTAPATPSALGANATGATTVALSWTDNASNETGFKIERKLGSGSYTQVGTVGANAVSYNDSGLVASTAYTYRVRANNAAGDSAYSNEATVTTQGSAPSAPSGLGANPTGATTVALAWTDNASNETGFKIERKLGSGSYAQVGTVGANVVSYNDSGLAALTAYTYRVRANNAAGDSAYSNEATATTAAGGGSANYLDNGDAGGIVQTGGWSAATTSTGFYGSNYLSDGNTGKGSKTVRFTPTLPAAGRYEVYLWWPMDATNATNVPVDVVHGAGTDLLQVNQRTMGGKWVRLGAYDFAAGSTGSVLISNAGTDGTVVADAAWFVPVSASAFNTDVSLAGSWSYSTGLGTYLSDGNTGKGSKTVTFTPNLPSAGTYEVFIRHWGSTSYANNVPVTITHASGNQAVTVNETINHQTWVSLGSYSFAAGRAGKLVVSNAGTTKTVSVDAVKFVKSGQAEIHVQAGGKTLGTSWTEGSGEFHNDNTGQGSTSYIQFNPTLPAFGSYQIYVRYSSGGNRPSNVPVSAVYTGGTANLTLNQTTGGGTWQLLGTYSITTTGYKLEMKTIGTSGYVQADAVRYVLPGSVDLVMDMPTASP